jgi:hypothetical protein
MQSEASHIKLTNPTLNKSAYICNKSSGTRRQNQTMKPLIDHIHITLANNLTLQLWSCVEVKSGAAEQNIEQFSVWQEQ